MEYSLAERGIEEEHLPAALNLGMAMVPWSPLANGFLTGKYDRNPAPDSAVGRLAPGRRWPVDVTLTDRHWRILDALTAVAGEIGRTPAQVALHWVTARPGAVGTLVGATTVDQLDANLDALDVDLSTEHRAVLDDASRLPERPPHVRKPNGWTGTHRSWMVGR